MSSTFKPLYYATAAAISISPENVASSPTFVAGAESSVVSNISPQYADVLISGQWTAGTTPTSGTVVQVFAYTPTTDDLASALTYPDVLDGTASAETFTSAGVMAGALWFLGPLSVDSATSNRTYFFRQTSLRSVLGFMPTRWGLFIAHNTGVNSNVTPANHLWYYMPVHDQAT